MSIEAPEKGYIFWPVGNGDSSTIVIDEGVFFQLDINHMAKSEQHVLSEFLLLYL